MLPLPSLPPPAPPPGFVANAEEGGYERRTSDGRLIVIDGCDVPDGWVVIVVWPDGQVMELFRTSDFSEAVIAAEVVL